MKLIKCNKCGRYVRSNRDDLEYPKCLGCGSTDISEHIYDETYKDVDWEQRRYEIAKSAMQGIIANSHDRDYRTRERYSSYDSWRKEYPNEIAETAVAFANALIAELKKNNKS